MQNLVNTSAMNRQMTRQLVILQMKHAIANVCNVHRRPIVVGAHRHVGSVLSITFQPLNTVRIADIENLAPEIARAARVANARIVQAHNGQPVIEVPAPARTYLADENAPLGQGARVALGPFVSQPGDCMLNLADSNSAHVLIVAGTGGGKTALAMTLLYQLMRQLPPHDIQFLVIDPAGNRFPNESFLDAMDRSAHLLHPICRANIEEALALMNWLAREVERRNRENVREPRIVVYIDELIFLMDRGNKALADAMQTIAVTGRVVNVHMIAATQYADREAIGKGLIKAQFTARLVGRVRSATESNLATGSPGWQCHLLNGRGDFVYAAQDRGGRFQSAMVPERALRSLLRTATSSRLDLGSNVPVITPQDPIDAIVAQIAPLVDANPTVSLRALERAVFGEQSNGGANYQKIKAARNRLGKAAATAATPKKSAPRPIILGAESA